MAALHSSDYFGSFNDDDSGIGRDRNNSSSTNLNSSVHTLIESSPSTSSLASTASVRKRHTLLPLVKVPSDDRIERVRPVAMKNSANGDFILCHTDRGNYVAHRTPVVPEWIARIVEEVERRQR